MRKSVLPTPKSSPFITLAAASLIIGACGGDQKKDNMPPQTPPTDSAMPSGSGSAMPAMSSSSSAMPATTDTAPAMTASAAPSASAAPAMSASAAASSKPAGSAKPASSAAPKKTTPKK